MTLASHNTMTYLKPDKWYMNLFRFIDKCQSKDIVEQYESGVRLFDIRIGFKNGNPVFKHGLATYKRNVEEVFEYLNTKDVIVRIIGEDEHPFLYDYCKHLEETYKNIKFYGGNRKSDWTKKIYNFKYVPDFTIEENYSSMYPNPRWYGIWPWLYSKLHKKIESGSDYLMIDFI